MADPSKSAQLQIRVSPAEKAAIQRRARNSGLDMSSYVLSRVLPAEAPQFADAVIACTHPRNASFAFADLNALLIGYTEAELERAVADRPPVRWSPYVANYVSAMVEFACARHNTRVPAWVREIPPLSEPAFGSTLAGLRLYLLSHSPPPFRRRNIFIDSTLGARV